VIFLLHFSPPLVPSASSYATLQQTNLPVPVLAVSVVVPLLGWSGVENFDWRGLAVRIGVEWGWSRPIDLFLDLRRALATPPK